MLPENEHIVSREAVRYALKGFLLGASLVLVCWFFVAEQLKLPLSHDLMVEVHDKVPLLYLIDLLPVIFAVLFARIGVANARTMEANLILEDRVRERTIEFALEKARNSAIIDNAADSIVAFDESGAITMVNVAAERVYGYKYSEVIGRSIRMLLPLPDGPLGEVLKMKESGGIRGRRELHGLRKDGTTIPLEVDFSSFSLGEELSFIAILRDLSERRKTERLEKSLLQVTEAVNQTQDLTHLYHVIHDSLGQVLDVTNFLIALCDEREPGRFHVAYAVDERDDHPESEDHIPTSLLRLVVKGNRPLLLDGGRLALMKSMGDVDATTPDVGSWLGVPLISNGATIGVMAVQNYELETAYTEKDLWVLNFASGQIANAIERESAREALRASEKRYRRLVEEAGDIVFSTDLSGRFTYVNPPILRLTGFAEEELIGQYSSSLVDDEWRPTVTSFFARQFRKRARETVLEFPIVTKALKRRWIEQKMTLLFEGNRPVAFQAIVHDITERREAEAALAEREERFRSLSASSPIGIFQADPKGICQYTNKRFQEITGRSLEETLGGGWIEAIHPEDRATFRTDWAFGQLDLGTTHSRELRVLRHDGEVRWVRLRWTCTTNDLTHVTGYVGTVEDITERRHTEALNAALYEISQAAVATTELDDFFGKIHEALMPIVDVTNFYIALLEPGSNMLSFPYAREGGERLRLQPRPYVSGLTGLIIKGGKPLLLNEDGLGRIYGSGQAVLIGKPAKSWLGVPLNSHGGTFGAVIVQSYTDPRHYKDADVQTMNFVSTQIATTVQRKQAEEAQRRTMQQLAEAHARIKEDLALAARIQQSRLPKTAPRVEGVEFAWLFDACDEVAGDMFNFVQLDETRVGIYILDVSGHGVPAALLSMSLSRSLTATRDGSGVLLRTHGKGTEPAPPAHVAETMNDRYPMNQDVNQYFTFLYGILDVESREFTFARAGHPAPIHVQSSGAVEIEDPCGPAIGILPQARYEEGVVRLAPGDAIILFTDGIDESANETGEEFGMGRILEVLSEARGGGVEASIQRLRSAVREFSAGRGQHDDITVVGFRLLPEA